MVDIRHRIGIAAPASAVYEHLATTAGLARWWTQDVRGASEEGAKVSFHFGGPDRYMVMEVLELRPDERVTWRCLEGPAEWLGTEITFDLRADPDETVVLFTHAGWQEPVEFMHHCTTKWGSYLVGLKHGLERGADRAFPHDEKVSGWD